MSHNEPALGGHTQFSVLVEGDGLSGQVVLNIYALACDGRVGLDYVLEFLNPGGFLVEEFSCDEQGEVCWFTCIEKVFGVIG